MKQDLECQKIMRRLEQSEADYAKLAIQFKNAMLDLARQGVTLNIPQVENGEIGGTQ